MDARSMNIRLLFISFTLFSLKYCGPRTDFLAQSSSSKKFFTLRIREGGYTHRY